MKKVIILNGSPRKNFNTAQMLMEAKKGAEAAGAEVEYFNLYDINYKGCVSCLACKLKGNITNGLCAYKDDLRPILEKCLNADAIIIGSPIYFSYPTGELRSFMERLLFAAHSYMVDKENGGLKRVLTRTIPAGIIFTMNIPESWLEQWNYPTILNENVNSLEHVLGYAEGLYVCDTTQFADFSKYDCDLFNAEDKAKAKAEHFEKDLQKAFDLGKRLTEMSK